MVLGSAAIIVAGSAIMLYPAAAKWVSQSQQAQAITQYEVLLPTSTKQQLDYAQQINEQMVTGAPMDLLAVEGTDVVAQIEVPSVGIALPVYPTSAESDLVRGAGHLEGTSLPVGGTGTHAAVTAHSGMVTASMFDNLSKVAEGDLIRVRVLGQTLAYRVNDISVETPQMGRRLLVSEADMDQLTLVTCTPYGVNTHRLLVTGVRSTDTESGLTPPSAQTFSAALLVGGAAAFSLTMIGIGVTRRRRRRFTPGDLGPDVQKG